MFEISHPSITQAGFELGTPPVSISQVPGFQAKTITSTGAAEEP